MFRNLAIAMAMSLVAATAIAQATPADAPSAAPADSTAGERGVTFALAPKVGTLGVGLELDLGLSSMLGVRASATSWSRKAKLTESGIRYDADIKIAATLLTADLHPFAGAFRVSVGVAFNGTHGDFTGRVESGTITINGVNYTASEVGSLNGKVNFGHANPYLGIGWGSSPKGRGFFLTSDLGAAFIKPKSTLTGTCGPALTGSGCAQFQSDVAAEEQQFRQALDSYSVYPVASIGLGWRF